MKIAVLGGVASTELLLHKLKEHCFDEVHVWGFSPPDTRTVSGWRELGEVCVTYRYEYAPFFRVSECQEALRDFEPDVLFAVGLSQILPDDMLALAKRTNVGFHPTRLPEGRGRAAIAWLILDQAHGAATFFELRGGVDDGPVFVQQPFVVTPEDDASSVEAKVLEAEAKALDQWLPDLAKGTLRAAEQEHDRATWYGRRTPQDGWIDWSATSDDVLRLVRASTAPHPGARTVQGETMVTVWRARSDDLKIRGVVGRIVSLDSDDKFTVQTGTGLVRVEDWASDGDWKPRVGVRFGYYSDFEVLKLRRSLASLEERVLGLATRLDAAIGNISRGDRRD